MIWLLRPSGFTPAFGRAVRRFRGGFLVSGLKSGPISTATVRATDCWLGQFYIRTRAFVAGLGSKNRQQQQQPQVLRLRCSQKREQLRSG